MVVITYLLCTRNWLDSEHMVHNIRGKIYFYLVEVWTGLKQRHSGSASQNAGYCSKLLSTLMTSTVRASGLSMYVTIWYTSDDVLSFSNDLLLAKHKTAVNFPAEVQFSKTDEQTHSSTRLTTILLTVHCCALVLRYLHSTIKYRKCLLNRTTITKTQFIQFFHSLDDS